MKKMILMSAMVVSAAISATAQDIKPMLEKVFPAFDTTWNQEVKIEQSNKLGLIAKKFDREWVAHYYLAYSKAVLSYNEKEAAKKDAYLDEAEKELEDAKSILGKHNDETHVLAAMIANARMGVDPMNRWQKYGSIFSENLKEAKEINENNPRMYYLQGVSKFFTPKQFGGGKKAALPYLEKADALFAIEAKANKDITQPHWGKEANDHFLSECKKEDKE